MGIVVCLLIFFHAICFLICVDGAVGKMVRKKRSEQSAGGESSYSQQGGRGGGGQTGPAGGNPGGGRGGGQTGPPQAGGGRGWVPQGQGGRGGYGGRGGSQQGGMSSQQSGGPVEYQGRGAQQHPRGGAPPQRRGGGGRGGRGGPAGGPFHTSVSELHQATQGSYQPGALPPQAMTSGKPVEQAEASSAVSPVQTGPSQVQQQFEQLSVQESSSQAIQPLPASSKSVRFPLRPGKGSTGTRCIVKANHFFAELPDKDLHQYDVIYP